MELRDVQAPLKARYRDEPDAARITLTARASEQDAPTACSIDLGRLVQAAQAHPGVGGAGTAACSGDLLLGALAACSQLTCQMVAEAMGIAARRIEVVVEGDLDLRGTLGVDREAPGGRPWASRTSACASRSTRPTRRPTSWRRCTARPSATAWCCRRCASR